MTSTLTREAELRPLLATKQAELDLGLQKGVQVDGNNITITADDRDKLYKLRDEIKDIKGYIDMEQLGIETKNWLEAPAGESISMQQAASLLSPKEIKSLGEMFVESKEFKERRANGDSAPMTLEGFQDIGGIGVGGMSTKADAGIYAGSSGTNTYPGPRPLGTIQVDPIVQRQYRATRVRDLFPVANTSASLIDYFRVLGFSGGAANLAGGTNPNNAAGMVPDTTGSAGSIAFGIKPQTALTWSSQQTPIRTIAHWEAAHRNVLDDMPMLRATIDNELLYGLRLKEDQQILSGSGINDELLGILNTPNIQSYTQANAANAATEQLSDTLRRAATKVVIAQYQSTGFVLHPNNWEDVELQKAAPGGDGQYMLVSNVAIGAQTQVWRQPVVETVAIPENTFLTGAFGLGAQLYDRQQANVRTAEQHANFFILNAILILVEERLGLAVKRPEAFVAGHFFVPTP